MGKLELTKFTTSRTWGKPPLPLYNILCASPRDPHPNGILSRDSQMGVPKFPNLGLPQLWGPIILCSNLWSRWNLKQSCSPLQQLSNDMLHVTFTQGNRADFRLLVAIWLLAFLLAITCVSSVQMGHARSFQTSKFQELFNDIRNVSIQWVLTLEIALWKFESPLGLQLPKWEFTWECEGSFSHTLLHSQKHEMWLLSSVLARTFVNPCLGHEPKVRVATFHLMWLVWTLKYPFKVIDQNPILHTHSLI
jgi:hypothetical protein